MKWLLYSSLIGTAMACTMTINATDLIDLTNAEVSTPLLEHIYSTHINCYNFTCNVIESYIPLLEYY